jgi:hypothetical protein
VNRFAALGLAAEALVSESRIIVLTPRRRDIAAAIGCFESIPEIAEHPGVRVDRRNGAERIDFAGRGRIVFTSVSSSLRGMSADVAFIDEAADRSLSPERLATLQADLEFVTAASPRGEIVRTSPASTEGVGGSNP